MKTPCADLIREEIAFRRKTITAGNLRITPNFLGTGIADALEKLLPQIESIESQSVENIMEEMPFRLETEARNYLTLSKVSDNYIAAYEYAEGEARGAAAFFCEGNTPSEALKELKKKLNQ